MSAGVLARPLQGDLFAGRPQQTVPAREERVLHRKLLFFRPGRKCPFEVINFFVIEWTMELTAPSIMDMLI